MNSVIHTYSGPRACYTEWSNSEREKQIYNDAYTWNLEKYYWWTYLYGRKGDADVENVFVDRVGEGEGVKNGETNIDIYKLPYEK